MSKFVTVVANPTTGQILTEKPGKPEFVTARVDQEGTEISAGNFLRKTRRTAFITGKRLDMEAFFKTDGQKIPGMIQRQTSKVPFYDNQSQVTNPTTGEPQGYYQNYVFLTDQNAASEVDVTEELVQASSKSTSAVVAKTE